MSSFKALLSIDEAKEYPLISCHYSFHQEIDFRGKAVSDVRGGIIIIQTDRVDHFLNKWMFDHRSLEDGYIRFTRVDNEGTLEKIAFKNAYCVNYVRDFHSNGSGSMNTTLTISAERLLLGTLEHDNSWDGSKK